MHKIIANQLVESLWITLGKIVISWVQKVNNRVVTHRAKNSFRTCSQFLHVSCTQVINMFLGALTPMKLSFYTLSTEPIITIYLKEGYRTI